MQCVLRSCADESVTASIYVDSEWKVPMPTPRGGRSESPGKMAFSLRLPFRRVAFLHVFAFMAFVMQTRAAEGKKLI